MNLESLTFELATSGEREWRKTRARNVKGDQGLVTWTPAATLTSMPKTPALSLGLSSTGTWLVVSPDGTVDDFKASGYYWPLFSLLEMSNREAVEALRSQFTSHHLNEAWLQYFPWEKIVAAALKSQSKFWPDLALLWVPSMPRTADMIEALEDIAIRGRTQQQRHRARKLLRTKCS